MFIVKSFRLFAFSTTNDHPMKLGLLVREDRAFLVVLVILGTCLFFALAQTWPLTLGRDWYRYLSYFHGFPEYANLYTMPLSPAILGLLAYGGYTAYCIFSLLSYILTLFSAYYLGRLNGIWVARAAALLILAHIQQLYFNTLINSDFLFAVFNAALVIVVVRHHACSGLSGCIMIGLAGLLLIMIRPIGQIFILLVLLPVVVHGISWGSLVRSATILATFLIGLLMLALMHQHYLGVFKATEGGKIGLICRTVYLGSKVLKPENGEYSRQLERLVDRMTDHPHYQKAGITTAQVFNSPNKLFLYEIADRFPESHPILYEACKEAIAAHPVKFLRGVWSGFYFQFTSALDPGPVVIHRNAAQPQEIKGADSEAFAAQRCPPTGCDRFELVETVTSMEARMTPLPPEEQAKADGLAKKLQSVEEIFRYFPDHPGLGDFFRSLIYKFPSLFFWICCCVFLLLDAKRPEIRVLILLTGLSVMTPVVSSLMDPLPHYRLPHDPELIVAGLLGIVILLARLGSWLLKRSTGASFNVA